MPKQGIRKGWDTETYAHADKGRMNNPPVGLSTPETNQDAGPRTYAHDPHLDPQLSWMGKTEHTSFKVLPVSLHGHERIDPRTIVETVNKQKPADEQSSLFASLEENPPPRQAFEVFKQRRNWSNRLVVGERLLVINSLIDKEGLGGLKDKISDLKPRARQYVILELGFFLGMLGRQHVCPLSKVMWKRLRTMTESFTPNWVMQAAVICVSFRN